MGLFLFAKIQQVENNNIGFNLEEVATLLKYSMKHMMLAYNECLNSGWFTEIERVGYYVVVKTKGG
jgi:hypothetical protein